jgi:hypothetical protein
MTKKILVAELEVQLVDLQLEEIDVHEWDIYTNKMLLENFYRMFYSGEGDPNSFTLAPFPTLKNTKGYDQAELERQGWCYKPVHSTADVADVSVNFFQLGGRKRSNADGSGATGTAQYGTAGSPKGRKGPETGAAVYNNAYFIGDPSGAANTSNKNFWAEEVIMNQMETDLALSREHWTETSKHKIEQELSFLTWGDAKVNFSRDKASLAEELENTPDGDVALLLVLVVTNAHPGIKNNHLNVHFMITKGS